MFEVVVAFVICVVIDDDLVDVVIVVVEGDEIVVVVFGIHLLFISSHIQQACHQGCFPPLFLKSRFHINASTIISIYF